MNAQEINVYTGATVVHKGVAIYERVTDNDTAWDIFRMGTPGNGKVLLSFFTLAEAEEFIDVVEERP